RTPRLGRAAGPCTRETRERRIAPRLLALLVALAPAVPVELGPLVALLGLDRSAQLHAFRRQLTQEARGRVLVRAAEEHAVPRVGEEAAVHRARDTDVTETALLLELALLLERARVRKDALLHPGQ